MSSSAAAGRPGTVVSGISEAVQQEVAPHAARHASRGLRKEEAWACHKQRNLTDVWAGVVFLVCLAFFAVLKASDAKKTHLSWLEYGLDYEGRICGRDEGVLDKAFVHWEEEQEEAELKARPICMPSCVDETRELSVVQRQATSTDASSTEAEAIRYRAVGPYCMPEDVAHRKELVISIETSRLGMFFSIQQVLRARAGAQLALVISMAVGLMVGFVQIKTMAQLSQRAMILSIVAPSIICFALCALYLLVGWRDAYEQSIMDFANRTDGGLNGLRAGLENATAEQFYKPAYTTTAAAGSGEEPGFLTKASSELLFVLNMVLDFCGEFLPGAATRGQATFSSLLCLAVGLICMYFRNFGASGLRSLDVAFECVRELPDLLPALLVFTVLKVVVNYLWLFDTFVMLTHRGLERFDHEGALGVALVFLSKLSEASRWAKFQFVYTTFMCIWILGIIAAFESFVIAYCAQLWYKNMNSHSHVEGEVKAPAPRVSRALSQGLRYHFGTLVLQGLVGGPLWLLRRTLLQLFLFTTEWMVNVGSEQYVVPEGGVAAGPPRGSPFSSGRAARLKPAGCWPAAFNGLRMLLWRVRSAIVKISPRYAVHCVVLNSNSYCRALRLGADVVRHDLLAMHYFRYIFRFARPLGTLLTTCLSMWLSWLIVGEVPAFWDLDSGALVLSIAGLSMQAAMVCFTIGHSVSSLFEQVLDTILFSWALEREYLCKRGHPRLPNDARLPGFLVQGPKSGVMGPQRVFEHSSRKKVKMACCSCASESDSDDSSSSDDDVDLENVAGGVMVRIHQAQPYASTGVAQSLLGTSDLAARVARLGAGTSSALYCTCKVVSSHGRIREEVKTSRQFSSSAAWTSRHYISAFYLGDTLEFTLWQHDEDGDVILGTALVTEDMLGAEYVLPRTQLSLQETSDEADGGFIIVEVASQNDTNALSSWRRQSGRGGRSGCCCSCCCCCCFNRKFGLFLLACFGVTLVIFSIMWQLGLMQPIIGYIAAQAYLVTLAAAIVIFLLYLLFEMILSIGHLCADSLSTVQRAINRLPLFASKDQIDDEDQPDLYEPDWMARRSPLPDPYNLMNLHNAQNSAAAYRDALPDDPGFDEVLDRMQLQRARWLYEREEKERKLLDATRSKANARCCGRGFADDAELQPLDKA